MLGVEVKELENSSDRSSPEALGLSEARASELERLSRLTEGSLNHHIIEGHLPNPTALRHSGLRFDAELALYLGVSLEETASTLVKLLTAMRTGGFRSTTTYASMQRLIAADILAIPRSASPDLVQRQLNSLFSYEDHLRSCLQVLFNLDLADGESGEPIVAPRKEDSFFKEFGLEPVVVG